MLDCENSKPESMLLSAFSNKLDNQRPWVLQRTIVLDSMIFFLGILCHLNVLNLS
jgi:hypothetical protein